MKPGEMIQRNAEIAFKRFRDEQLARTKEEIFECAGKIRFYIELHAYLTENDLAQIFEEDEQIQMADSGISFVESLHDEYLKQEYTSIDTWDDIYELIQSFLKREA